MLVDKKIKFLECLAETLDCNKAADRAGISLDQAQSILKGLVPEGLSPAPKGARYVANIDGASRGNPGKAGAGAVIKDAKGVVVRRLRRPLGIATNNVAEYSALLLALEAAHEMKVSEIEILADSELLVRQINGIYRVKSDDLKPLYMRAKALLKSFDKAHVRHVYRTENAEADSLANEAIDKGA